jgi:hypothetical protein
MSLMDLEPTKELVSSQLIQPIQDNFAECH